jgi:hypothetical protein
MPSQSRLARDIRSSTDTRLHSSNRFEQCGKIGCRVEVVLQPVFYLPSRKLSDFAEKPRTALRRGNECQPELPVVKLIEMR